MRKRIAKPKRINLNLLYPVYSANTVEASKYDTVEDDYNPEVEYDNPEYKKIIPDGEAACINAIKEGQDW